MKKILLPIIGFLGFSTAFGQTGNACNSPIDLGNSVQNFCQVYSTGPSQNNGTLPACWTAGADNSKWFKFTASAAALDVQVFGNDINNNGTLNRPQVMVKDIAAANQSCISGVQHICGSDATGQNFVNVHFGTLKVGNVYNIRVDGGSNFTGTFKLCVNNYTAPLTPGQDCINATILCNKNPLTQGSFSGAGFDDRESPGTCLDLSGGSGPIEANSLWYTWVCDTSGSLTFDITPVAPGSDVDFALYELPAGNCGAKTKLRCVASADQSNPNGPCMGTMGLKVGDGPDEEAGCQAGDDNYAEAFQMIKGRTYALLIDYWAGPIDNLGFNLSFGGTGTFLGPKSVIAADPSGCIAADANGELNVSITDSSNSATAAWEWDFGSDATPSTIQGQGPHDVKFSTSGTKTVVLTTYGVGGPSNGCPVVSSAQIDVWEKPDIAMGKTNVNCFGDASGVGNAKPQQTGTAPYTYLWDDPLSQTTKQATGLTAGSYSVIVTDVNGCKDTNSVVVTQPDTAVVVVTGAIDANCGQADGMIGSVSTGGTAPYTYSWSPGGQTTDTVVDVAADNYTVTVTDGNGCVETSAVTVNDNAAGTAAVNSSNNVACNSGNDGSALAGITGGTAPFTYSWSNGDTSSTADSLSAGTYTVTITDINGCNTTASINITEPPLLTVNTSGTDVLCFGDSTGSATATTSGGTGNVDVTWSTSDTTTNIADLGPGTYTVDVIDENNCTATTTVTIAQPGSAVSADASGNNSNVACNGGSDGAITISANGGVGGFTYDWDPNVGTSGNLENLAAGTYNITVTDANGCSDTTSTTLTEPEKLVASITASTVKCKGGADGTVSVEMNGGVEPYTYVWNDNAGQTGATAAGLIEGDYTVSVTDSNGCTTSGQGNVGVAAVVDADFTADPPRGPEPHDVEFENTSIGGSSYHWDFGDGTTSTEFDPDHRYRWHGTYNVVLTITSADSCVDTAMFDIIVDPVSLLWAPNVFTPDADDVNDVFYPIHKRVTNFRAEIYNRWGELLYYWENPNAGWDGRTNSGEEATESVYYWILKADGLDGEVYDLHGTVHLIRND